VHELAAAIGATKHCLVQPPVVATRDDLLSFHDEEYVDKLQTAAENCAEDESQVLRSEGTQCPARRPIHLAQQDDDELEDYGLVDDCPVFPELWDYVLYVQMACLCTGRGSTRHS
jgi:acetoin utilization deacetylase AcuC-like enzyme